MSRAEKKSFTDKGRSIARYTLVVKFKPEYVLPNPNTGEMKERWTYRCDTEIEKLWRLQSRTVKHLVDSLLLKFIEDKGKYVSAVLYDNSLPAYTPHEDDKGNQQVLINYRFGKFIYPEPGSERYKKLLERLKMLGSN